MIIPFNIASGTYTLKLFNEHINGDFKTDYASASADVTLSVNSAIGKNGEDGVTPILKIGTDNIWYVSYDKGVTWTSLGVSAAGIKGDTGADGADGLTPYVGENGNWWIGGTDTGVRAAAGTSTATVIALAAGAALAGNAALAAYILSRRRKSAV